MFSKKTILIGIIILALIGVISAVFLSTKNQDKTVIVDTKDGVSGDGGFVDVAPSPTTGGRFEVKSDPTQPYVAISPRGAEPVRSDIPVGQSFEDYDKAVAEGLIPDKEGLYRQKANPNYDPSRDGTYDYGLASNDFLNTYYGSGTVNDIVTGNSPFDRALNSSPGSSLVVTEPEPTPINVESAARISINLDNSDQALRDYYSKLSQATTELDLVNNLQDSYLNLLQVQTVEELTSLKNSAETAKNKIERISTPGSLKIMAQHHYNLYDAYSRYADIALSAFSNEGITEEELAELDGAFTTMNNILDLIKVDLNNLQETLNS